MLQPIDAGAIAQDPDNVIKRTIDWGSAELVAAGTEPWLPSGETISSAVIVDADDATVTNVSFDTKTVTFKAGGIVRALKDGGHRIVCRIVTSAGETGDATLVLYSTAQ